VTSAPAGTAAGVPLPLADRRQYAQVSTLFWEAAHGTLIGNGRARHNLARLEDRPDLLRARRVVKFAPTAASRR
jgi:hypothetical protein